MRPYLPLNALRAFESSARYLSFTQAAQEMHVTQAAVSQQVRMLEERLRTVLFKRLPRGLEMTDEGRLLLPVLTNAFTQIETVLKQLEYNNHSHEVLSIGAVGTFAISWLMPRLKVFRENHPFIELRLLTNNNLVNHAAEGLDFAIRFGDGSWPTTHNVLLFEAPLTVLCSPKIAQRLNHPQDLQKETLLRSYRTEEWSNWLTTAGLEPWVMNGPMFDSSRLMVEAAILGEGVALAPDYMFSRELSYGLLVRPFNHHINVGGYWVTSLKSRPTTPAMQCFYDWLIRETTKE
ncbi:LysR family transcriptional regulator [Zooshikella marina]|uniref:LysR family transcriptional regulator n=1 Tax=Zooshikella ganghwensis TaxID=202772 RepID=UPI001BAF0E03|nr:LysR family transcriptional regulator [Zooshikella ganghwensis]MBU2704982.1 LysR family transcriptional regulator [Zooshikella ganghwensis]